MSSSLSLRMRVLIGVALALSPLLIQIPFATLGATFDYPDILRRPPAEVLTRFAAGGDGLIVAWYAYALCVVPFLATVIVLPELLSVSASRARLIRVFGVISAVTQLIGLLRWTFVVPSLATAFVDPTTSAATRAAIEVAFDVQHRLFGNMLGEHVGQLTLGIWTLLIAGTQSSHALRWLGRAAGTLFLLGLMESIWLEQLPLIAFLLWTAWTVATGVTLAWGQRRPLKPIIP